MKLLSFAAITLLILNSENTLVGRWAGKPSEKGNVTSVLFKADNTLEGFVNKKPFVKQIDVYRSVIGVMQARDKYHLDI